MPDSAPPGVGRLNILTDDGVELAGEQTGAGLPIVLLHGLTATRRYVVMGSRLLERSGRRVIAYDARGHGRSAPAPDPGAYGYDRLARDLLAVMDSLGLERALLAGASMGSQTIVRCALEHPDRVAALGLITPAYDPDAHATGPDGELAAWDALARGLREGGVEGFMAAYDFTSVPDAWRATVEKVVRQRLSAHDHPEAVADALQTVPRSRPFECIEELAGIDAPTVVIASRDEADPGHPLAVGERYARTIPGARLLVEEPGKSPLAWQGGQVSRALLDLAAHLPQERRQM
ncbi:MAG TPA: alpha/beta hydrolase [Solirubrobacteraceae bacterium]|jgi:pimeloyl-ACP methyl ester carboxylesterase|nr:alpha/beta hydrolase [Solirubrobacteraceae bacterium]